MEADYNEFTEDATFLFEGASPIDHYNDFVDIDRTQLTANLDYVNPLNETTKMELGAQALLFETQIGYSSTGETLNWAGELLPTPGTEFVYSRDFYSAYATLSKKLGKVVSVQLGEQYRFCRPLLPFWWWEVPGQITPTQRQYQIG